MKDKLNAMVNEYGSVALVTYLAISALVIIGFAFAIALGFKTDSTAKGLALLFAAWAAAKVTVPLRIVATLALTPIVAKVVRRFRKAPTPET